MEKELPKGWKLLCISGFTKTSSGGTPSTTHKEYWDGNIPWINSGKLKNDTINSPSKLITELGLKESSARIFPKGTTVIALTGATTGKVGFLNIETSTNQSIVGIFPNEVMSNKLLFYQLQHLKPKILENSLGSAQPHINKKIVDNLLVKVPPEKEQKRILAKLENLFINLATAKKDLEQIPVLLKQFRQAVLTQAVTGKLTNSKTINWEQTKIGSLINSIDAGKSFRCIERPVKEGEVGIVKVSAVSWGFFDERETKTVDKPELINKNYFIKEGDFLMSRANTIELVGATLIVKHVSKEIMLSDKIWRVKFKNDITKSFINILCKSKIGRAEIENRSSGNQLSMRNLSQNSFLDIPILLPSESEQTEIVRRVEALFSKADAIEEHYKRLKTQMDQLPQAILAKAFRGEM